MLIELATGLYKLLLIIYKSLHNMTPDYITARLTYKPKTRPILQRSEDEQLVIRNSWTLWGYIISKPSNLYLSKVDSFKSK